MSHYDARPFLKMVEENCGKVIEMAAPTVMSSSPWACDHQELHAGVLLGSF